jgi:aminoglycoside 6-adenylyltransferase
MRSETEMMGLILAFAKNREEIRAVVMNGSRANPSARRDPFQDYDIACYVTDVKPFRGDLTLPELFGELMILQLPDDMGDPAPDDAAVYAYLMQFMDGNRIDLSFHPLERMEWIARDSLSVILLDKDQRIPALPPASELSYLPQNPSAKAFEDCCNEFWWVMPYAAKGLWRSELTYTHAMLDDTLRGELMKMLSWYFGLKTDFQQSSGKFGKNLHSGLSEEEWHLLERTYADSDAENIWQALFSMGSLFRLVARTVAQKFNFIYPEREDEKVSAFIRMIHELPPNSESLPM